MRRRFSQLSWSTDQAVCKFGTKPLLSLTRPVVCADPDEIHANILTAREACRKNQRTIQQVMAEAEQKAAEEAVKMRINPKDRQNYIDSRKFAALGLYNAEQERAKESEG